MAIFIGGSGFTPVGIVAPATQEVVLTSVLVWSVGASASVLSCACMAFMVTMIYANFAVTDVFDLVRTSLACASPSS